MRNLVLSFAACLSLAACTTTTPTTPLAIVEVSYSQTVVLPGETIVISVQVDGSDAATIAWTADAGEFEAASAAETTWTAPPTEQLVAMKVTATDGERSAEQTIDLLVGFGADHDGDGYSMRQGDCDDARPTVFPGAPDGPDGLDNDCDGVVDEGSIESDDDGDGYADDAGDCDDADADVHPGATELPNGADDDCDNRVDEGTDFADDDGDGHCEAATCSDGAAGGDCNDQQSSVHPGAPEILDGVDNDCDGERDEATAGFDDDGDGFTELQGDCDDASTGASPAESELLDGVDNDCDGLVDEDFLVDVDGDGWPVAAGDCDDGAPTAYPGAPEFADGLDNDCNGAIDDAMDTADDDGDGFAEADGDCDDGLATVYPGAPELDDGAVDFDNDCDGFFFVNPPFALSTASTDIIDTCGTVTLDGAGAWDPDGDALSWYWYFAWQPIDSELASADIVGGDSPAASFSPDRAGRWVVGLLVSDGQFNSAPTFLEITVTPGVCAW